MKFFSLTYRQMSDLLFDFPTNLMFGVFSTVVDITDFVDDSAGDIRPYHVQWKRYKKRVVVLVVGNKSFGISWRTK
jgi:hypothetical protein